MFYQINVLIYEEMKVILLGRWRERVGRISERKPEALKSFEYPFSPLAFLLSYPRYLVENNSPGGREMDDLGNIFQLNFSYLLF